MDNLCACGCRQTVKPGNTYLNGHNIRGKNNCNWKGGRRRHSQGYVFILSPDHPYKNHQGYVFEHILVMEKSLGRYILPLEAIHHIDGDKTNNNIGNLLLFKTNSMHVKFEARLRSYKECGHWDWLKCWVCKQYDKPENLYIEPKSERKAYHPVCVNEYNKKRYHAKIGKL